MVNKLSLIHSGNVNLQKLEPKNRYKNVSLQEQNDIINNQKAVKFVKFSSIGAGVAAVSIVGVLVAIGSGKCNKTINNILSFLSKPINYIGEKLRNSAKNKLKNEIDFSKARSHFHNIGTNKQGLVSGAHEIVECVETLLNEGGDITSITQSKTSNGIWEIMYKIGEIVPDEPKSVYLNKELSVETIEDLINLCKKYKNETLDFELQKLIQSNVFIDSQNMEKMAENALKNGYVTKSKTLLMEACKAHEELEKLQKQIIEAREKLQQAEQDFDKISEQKEKYVKKSDFNPKSEEFKTLLSQYKIAKECKKTLNGEVLELENTLEKTKKHYENVKNSVNIFGDSDGKLFSAFAHYDEKGKLVVDSYFPISHGSKLHSAFMDALNSCEKISISDIKYLIGAPKCQFNKFCNKLYEKFMGMTKLFMQISCIPLTVSNIHSDRKIDKLNKEREKMLSTNV